MLSSASELAPTGSVAYLNGNVYTVNTAQRWAEAFIISPDGIFTAIGLNDEIRLIAKENSLVTVNLNGRFVMPGIHDSHVHTFHSGLHLLSDVLMDFEADETTLDGKGMMERMKSGSCACAFHGAYSDWIVGVLYEAQDFDRADLDQEWPNNPVIIHGGGGHSKYLNTLGLQRAGFDIASEPDAEHAYFLRRQDGSLTGAITGQNAMGRANLAVTRPTLSHVKRALRRALSELHRYGVTSCQEAAANTLLLEALHELDVANQLQMDYSTHILYRNEWLSGELLSDPEELIRDSHQYRSKHVDTRFIKFMMDGTPNPVHSTISHLDENGSPEMDKILEPNLADLIKKWDKHGMTCKVHCMGQGAVKLTLDAISQVRKGHPGGPRHEIAHCSAVQDGDFGRFRALNVTAEMSPAMFFKNDFVGQQFGWDFPKMVEAQNLVTIGSDWAFGMRLPLFPAVAPLVKQIGSEAIIEMLTINGAKAVSQDHRIGSIAPGKTANFIAVDRDLTKGDFANATVTQTWFEGEVVFDGEGIFRPRS
ncbi:hypothetical protein FALCPG4_015654 [Fusarium falciforme]